MARREDGHQWPHFSLHREECLRFGPRAEKTAQLRHHYAVQIEVAVRAHDDTKYSARIIGEENQWLK